MARRRKMRDPFASKCVRRFLDGSTGLGVTRSGTFETDGEVHYAITYHLFCTGDRRARMPTAEEAEIPAATARVIRKAYDRRFGCRRKR